MSADRKKPKQEPLKPTPSTIKKLMARSGNQCAFAGCVEPIVDREYGTMVGDIAHIKGEKQGAARFDKNQNPEQRRAYANLILLCKKHHAIVDDKANLATFTIAKLQHLKTEHEQWFDEKRDRNWIRLPNQIVTMAMGQQIKLSFWVDRDGKTRFYSDEQIEILNRLMQLYRDMNAICNVFEQLQQMRDHQIIDSLLQQSWAKVDWSKDESGEPRPPIAHLLILMAGVPDVAFREFHQLLVKGGDPSGVIDAAALEKPHQFWTENTIGKSK